MLLEIYFARKLHQKALELVLSAAQHQLLPYLKRMKQIEKRMNDRVSGDLQSSHDSMVQYLRVVGKKHAELVTEFSRRVLSVNPVIGLAIFT